MQSVKVSFLSMYYCFTQKIKAIYLTFSIAYFSKKSKRAILKWQHTFANFIFVSWTKKYFAILWSLIGLMTYDDVISCTPQENRVWSEKNYNTRQFLSFLLHGPSCDLLWNSGFQEDLTDDKSSFFFWSDTKTFFWPCRFF